MDVSRALDQIAEIHQQIAKGEVYRGYRSLPVAASGLIGIAAAWLQPAALGTAIRSASSGTGPRSPPCAGIRRLQRDHLQLRRPRRRRGPPADAAGGRPVPAEHGWRRCHHRSFSHLSAALVPLLPGLWAICFGIGMFASRPYLPRASGWMALFYYAAGSRCLWQARGPESR